MTSDIETAILNSNEPIMISDDKAKEIVMKANGEKVILLNKTEIDNWIGPIPINDYPINKDPNPIIVNKKPKPIDVKQQVAVKYLEPPPAPTPGEIIIQQEGNKLPPVAPPLIIRQVPNIPAEPETLIIRELPPEPPVPPPKKIITIAGKLLPPPPRKVIIERLPEMPEKRPDIILERWLPYKDVPRKITLVPKPPEIEELSCGSSLSLDSVGNEDDDRKYSVQDPIFIESVVKSTPFNPNAQYRSNFISPLITQQQKAALNHHLLNSKLLQQIQQQQQQKQQQQPNQKHSSPLLNKSYSLQQTLQVGAALTGMPSMSNFSLIQQSSLLPSHLQSAYSTPTMFQSPSQSSFMNVQTATYFHQPNYMQRNYFTNSFSPFYPKKINGFTNFTAYSPFMHSPAKNRINF